MVFERLFSGSASEVPPSSHTERMALARADETLQDDLGQIMMAYRSADMSVDAQVLQRVTSALNLPEDDLMSVVAIAEELQAERS